MSTLYIKDGKTHKKCFCEWCTVTSPLIKKIRDALPPELKDGFEDIVLTMMTAEEDRDVAEEKLRGRWPGWEWMKKVLDDREKDLAKSEESSKI